MTLADSPPTATTPVPTSTLRGVGVGVEGAPGVGSRAPTTARPRRSRSGDAVERTLLAVAVAVTVVAAALRFAGPKALWLDEALTVNISRLPLAKLFDALRLDGSPPAYYLLLHAWMGLFGTGTRAVRALPGVLSLATLPVAWRLGRAVGGRRVAVAVLVVVACNPFALRYATENRMYALVMLLSTLAALSLIRSFQRPTVGRLVGFGVLCGLLLLTHYWALYLVAAAGVGLALGSVRGPVRAQARLGLAALCGGCLVFLPWAPSFVFQIRHTGTPWATAASPRMLIETIGEFAGWERGAGVALFVVYCLVLAALAGATGLRAIPAVTRAGDALGWRRAVPGARFAGPVGTLTVGTMVLAMVGGIIASAAFAYRYASVVLPLAALLVALGVTAVGRTRLGCRGGAALLVVIAVFGTIAGAQETLAKRTEAVVVAARIAADARPGDVVAYCPDQLGPAVSRLLPDRLLTQVTFPRWDDPGRINWVDYARVNAAATPGVFAHQILSMAGSHQVWLVWQGGYRTFGRSCQEIRDTLMISRPHYTQPVRARPATYYEYESLVRFAAH